MGFAIRFLTGCLAWLGLTVQPGPAKWPESSTGGPDHAIRALYARPASVPFPASDPYTNAKTTLGRSLFYDPILSGSRTIACSSCHDPARAWGDGKAHAVGMDNSELPLRSPTLMNVAWIEPPLGWDGKFASLEAVAFAPITGARNMGSSERQVVANLAADPHYRTAFATAFGDEAVSRTRIEQALATFERTIVTGSTPFDRWIEGRDDAVDDAAKRGFALFRGRAGCSGCHDGWAFTDGGFHDIGVAADDDPGRGRLFPTSSKLQHAFKTPTLRNVTLRAPFMHNGAYKDLDAVLDLYDRGGIARDSRDPLIHPLGLQAAERADLRAFLATLTEDVPDTSPALP